MNNNEIITIDNNFIYLRNKTELNANTFINSKTENFFCNNIYDVCKINEKCLLFSHCKNLVFFSIDNLKIGKTISNIDCIKDKEEKSLILIRDCVLVNCLNGIAIISTKTKELIQYIENWENFKRKKIYKSNQDYIYISNSLNDLFKFSFNEYNLELFEKIKVRDSYGEIRKKSYDSIDDLDDIIIGNSQQKEDINLINYNIIIKDDYLFIFDYSIYIVKYKE